jgi:hypothetical protein
MKEDMSQQDFWKRLAQELICNDYFNKPDGAGMTRGQPHPQSDHELITIASLKKSDKSG